MADISLEDIRSIYVGSVCVYKEIPVYFQDCSIKRVAIVRNLITRRDMEVPFKLEEFSAPHQRIGYVNHYNNAYYLKRLPVRRFNVGIHVGNLDVKFADLPEIDSYRGAREILEFNLPTLAASILNQYPTFEQARDKAQASKGIYAFDKQFAITWDKRILYKNQFVGKLKGGKLIKHISFLPEFEYLSILLKEQDYGKAAQTIKDRRP